MARLSLVLLLAAAPLVLGGPFSSLFHKHKAHYNPAAEDAGSDGPGTPLLLTPYIENGQIELGTSYVTVCYNTLASTTLGYICIVLSGVSSSFVPSSSDILLQHIKDVCCVPLQNRHYKTGQQQTMK